MHGIVPVSFTFCSKLIIIIAVFVAYNNHKMQNSLVESVCTERFSSSVAVVN